MIPDDSNIFQPWIKYCITIDFHKYPENPTKIQLCQLQFTLEIPINHHKSYEKPEIYVSVPNVASPRHHVRRSW